MLSALFTLVNFEIRVSFFVQAGPDLNPPILSFPLALAGMTVVHLCTQLLVEMGVLQTFCLGWSQTMILPISDSQVSRIVGCKHLTPSKYLDFDYYMTYTIAKTHQIEHLSR
jgi:hypothetical protein